MVLQFGPPQAMHPAGKNGSGEQMLGGMMATCSMPMSGMAMGRACNHHVEVHVYKVSDGRVVRKARVSITLRNNNAHGEFRVPIMTIMGMDGRRDAHSGNNVYVAPCTALVLVSVNGVRVAFSVRLT